MAKKETKNRSELVAEVAAKADTSQTAVNSVLDALSGNAVFHAVPVTVELA